MIPWELFTSISLYLISEGDEIFRDCDRNIETAILTEYEQMWKWMVEFLRKFQGSGINIDVVNSIRVTKPLIFFNILRVVVR